MCVIECFMGVQENYVCNVFAFYSTVLRAVWILNNLPKYLAKFPYPFQTKILQTVI